ncbi:hypothetical protein AB4Y64_00185 [Lysobacter sp. TAF61]
MAGVVPTLPVVEVRAAIAAEDWSLADALLEQYHLDLVASLRKAGSPLPADGPWLDLLRQQDELIAELRSACDATELAIARLGADRRGARAWLRELA